MYAHEFTKYVYNGYTYTSVYDATKLYGHAAPGVNLNTVPYIEVVVKRVIEVFKESQTSDSVDKRDTFSREKKNSKQSSTHRIGSSPRIFPSQNGFCKYDG